MRTPWVYLAVLSACTTLRPSTSVALYDTCEDGICEANESVATCPIDCQPAWRDPDPPALAVVAATGELHRYRFAPTATGWTASDEVLAAALQRAGDVWTLSMHARAPIAYAMFPWQEVPARVSPDERVYFTYLGGAVEREGRRAPYAWWGLRYPGEAFAPLLVIADDQRATLLASATWPPVAVSPMHARGQSILKWLDPIAAGSDRTVRAIVAEYTGGAGYAPWQLAILRYRAWLASVVPEPRAPAWIELSEGFLNVQLQNFPTFTLATIADAWRRWRPWLDWLVVWGKASTYAGPAGLAEPAPHEGEEVGCCVERAALHPRYAGLAELAATITKAGGHVAYYARPSSVVGIVPGRAALRTWLAGDAALGADSAYLDTVGRTFAPDPPRMLALFDDGTIPRAAMLEGFVDIYPRPALVSGYVAGDATWRGGPGIDPRTCERCSFVRLGRLLLGARPIYFGASNGELGHADPTFAMRQAFLIGAKLEVIVSDPPDATADAVVQQIIALRRGVRWWQRSPLYLDTLGLTGVPPGIDARRFRTADGAELLAIDNAAGRAGELSLKQRRVGFGPERLSIVEVR